MTAPRPPWRAYGALAASMALVGSYVALSKPLVAAMPVFLLAWLRYLIGAAAMAHWVRRPPQAVPLSRRTHALLFLQGLLGNFLFSICMLYGVSLTTASAAGVIMAAIPAVVALQSALFLRERLDGRSLAAIALAATGIGLFSLGKDPAGSMPTAAAGTWLGLPLSLWGNALVLAAVGCEAAYVVIGKRLTGDVGPKRIAALINLWGLALMTPLGVWAAWRYDWGAMTAPLWALLVFYGLAASVWTVWLWMTGLRHVSAARAGVFTVMLPVSATAIGVLVMGERLSGPQWLAFALALLGLVVATMPVRSVTRTTDPSAG
ncbi:2A78: carboxylate/amino acid/amine transporter [Tepidimonas thermarum]|uniref:2A78: carboxylate/amino acid/amine transporter n=1 Tax=Tepidimonas thermarum TaxID=335431 RepID=A0A554X3A0_9BURK|nr:DMT family transporter [Tepidimonas thermarum]TSE30321.1 2A78: carboxylate/amino acid/amine transporter [Tepidimonas thermarum]